MKKLCDALKNAWDLWVWACGMQEGPEDWDVLYGRLGMPPVMFILFFIFGGSLTIAGVIQILRYLGVIKI